MEHITKARAGSLLFPALFAAGLVHFFPGAASAQITYHICASTLSGSLYGILMPNTPTTCKTNHFRFSVRDYALHAELPGLDQDDHPLYLRHDGARPLTGSIDASQNTIMNVRQATAPGEVVPFEQALKDGQTVAGDVGGFLPNQIVVRRIQTIPVSSTAPVNGQVLTFNAAVGAWEPASTRLPRLERRSTTSSLPAGQKGTFSATCSSLDQIAFNVGYRILDATGTAAPAGVSVTAVFPPGPGVAGNISGQVEARNDGPGPVNVTVVVTCARAS